MRSIARFMDARNTTEGKFLSVLLSLLLVFSFLNIGMFTDFANAEEDEVVAQTALQAETDEVGDKKMASNEDEVGTKESKDADQSEANQSKSDGEDEVVSDNESDNIKDEGADDPTDDPKPEDPEEADKAGISTSGDQDSSAEKRPSKKVNTLGVEDKVSVFAEVSSGNRYTVMPGEENIELRGQQGSKQSKKWEIASGHDQSISEKNWSDKNSKDKAIEFESKGKDKATISVDKNAKPGSTYIIRHEIGYGVVVEPYEYFYITVDSQEAEVVEIESIDTNTIEVGKAITLTATTTPAGAKIAWESSDSSIADVDGQGKVTAKKTGEVTITAKSGSAKDSITIRVVPQTYTISFDANGGSGSVPDSIDCVENEIVSLPGKPDGLTRDGYIFIGWCTNRDASGVYEGVGWYPRYEEGSEIQMGSQSFTLYAAWARVNGEQRGNIKAAIIHADTEIPAEPGIFSGNNFNYTELNSFPKTNVNLVDWFTPVITTVGVDSVEKALTDYAKQQLENAVIQDYRVSYDPNTDYIAWHVIKDQKNDNYWHIDGTIQKKGNRQTRIRCQWGNGRRGTQWGDSNKGSICHCPWQCEPSCTAWI